MVFFFRILTTENDPDCKVNRRTIIQTKSFHYQSPSHEYQYTTDRYCNLCNDSCFHNLKQTVVKV